MIALGGMIGATARYEVGVGWPVAAGHFPWATFSVNVLGCGLIGILIVVVSDVWAGQRLLRPFLGTGVLGGFTTFSTYAVDARGLLAEGHVVAGIGYLLGTLLAALLAVQLAASTTRKLVIRRRGSVRIGEKR